MKKIISLLSALFFVMIFITSCGPSAVVVRERPYAPRYERPAAPGPNYVWVAGEWVTHRNGYVYRQGYWAYQRPRHMFYIPGQWQNRRHGWVWIHGHWQ